MQRTHAKHAAHACETCTLSRTRTYILQLLAARACAFLVLAGQLLAACVRVPGPCRPAVGSARARAWSLYAICWQRACAFLVLAGQLLAARMCVPGPCMPAVASADASSWSLQASWPCVRRPTTGGAQHFLPPPFIAYPPVNAAYPPFNAAYPPFNAAYPPFNAAYPPFNAAYPPCNAAFAQAAAEPDTTALSVLLRWGADPTCERSGCRSRRTRMHACAGVCARALAERLT
eukprot:356032-Chlamydomonas_euryale.AAC.3